MIMCAAATGGLIWRLGGWKSRVDQLLEQIVKTQEDHEERLRAWRL
jgi:hypothetical protein